MLNGRVVIEPFQILKINENSFYVNGGKLINYYNPMKNISVRFNRDDTDFLPLLNKNQVLDSSKVFSITDNDKIGYVCLVCEFKAPKYHCSGTWFVPDFQNAWLKLIKLDKTNTRSEVNEPNVSNNEKTIKLNGNYATIVCILGLVHKNDKNELETEQFHYGDVFYTEWQSNDVYYRNNIGEEFTLTKLKIQSLDDSRGAMSSQLFDYKKGYCTANESVSNTIIF